MCILVSNMYILVYFYLHSRYAKRIPAQNFSNLLHLYQPIYKIKTYSFSVAKQKDNHSHRSNRQLTKLPFCNGWLPRLPLTFLVVLHCQTC